MVDIHPPSFLHSFLSVRPLLLPFPTSTRSCLGLGRSIVRVCSQRTSQRVGERTRRANRYRVNCLKKNGKHCRAREIDSQTGGAVRKGGGSKEEKGTELAVAGLPVHIGLPSEFERRDAVVLQYMLLHRLGQSVDRSWSWSSAHSVLAPHPVSPRDKTETSHRSWQNVLTVRALPYQHIETICTPFPLTIHQCSKTDNDPLFRVTTFQ